MAKFCPECGNENTDSARFCEKCGKEMKGEVKLEDENKKRAIWILVGVIAILAILIALTLGGFLTHPDETMKLEPYDFGYVTMMVPEGSSFNEYDSVGKGTAYWAIGYSNSGEYKNELVCVWIGNYNGANSYLYDFVENDGDLQVYNTMNKNTYMIQKHVGSYYVDITGMGDLDTLKEIANSIEAN